MTDLWPAAVLGAVVVLTVTGLIIPVLFVALLWAVLTRPIVIPGRRHEAEREDAPPSILRQPRIKAKVVPTQVVAVDAVALDSLVPVSFEPCPRGCAGGWVTRLEDGRVHMACPICEGK